MTIHVPHNPHYIDEDIPPPPVIRPRKANAGKWQKLQQQSLVQQPARPARPAFGRLVAEFGILNGWLAMWLLNGAATAFGFAALALLGQQRGLAVGLDRQSWLVIGWAAHIFISAIEQHLWRSGDYDLDAPMGERVRAFFASADRLRLALAVTVGAIDSFSTAWYLRRILYTIVEPRFGWTVVVALLAATIALAAEPLLRNFAYKLRVLVVDYKQEG